MFENDFEFVAIHTDTMEGGEEVFSKLKKERSGGLPWIVALDGEGQELVASIGPKGNIGCPVEPHEVEYFVEMIRQSSDIDEDGIKAINDSISAFAKKMKNR